jgi:hypothetical protein
MTAPIPASHGAAAIVSCGSKAPLSSIGDWSLAGELTYAIPKYAMFEA